MRMNFSNRQFTMNILSRAQAVRMAPGLLLCLGSVLSAQAQNLAVSEGGQAVYSYPIAVPPGVGGMEPKLSLVYQSGGINGPLGVGWSIQGLSQITRCGKVDSVLSATTGEFKPKVAVIDFLETDSLCLDGKRLIKVSSGTGNYVGSPLPAAEQVNSAVGISGSGRVEFRTENDGFSRIFASGMTGGLATSGPATFAVQSKSGLTQVYGQVAAGSDGVVRAVGGNRAGVAAAWLLKTITDTVGNTIEFNYENVEHTWGTGPAGAARPGREWNLQSVTYGCNYTAQPGCTAKHKVEFFYDGARPDKSEAYHLGAKVVGTQLLRRVVVTTAASVAVRNYRLTYTASPATSRQLLSSVQECAGVDAQKCFPATSLSYTPTGRYVNVAFNLAGTSLWSADGSPATGDFNGDGKTDLMLLRPNAGTRTWVDVCTDQGGEAGVVCVPEQTGPYIENELWLADAAVPGRFNKVANLGSLAQVKLVGSFPNPGPNDSVETSVTDVNGDGRADLMVACRSDNLAWCPVGTKLRIWLSISDSDAASPAYGQFVAVSNPASGVQGPLFRYKTRERVLCNEIDDGQYTYAHKRMTHDTYWQDFDGDGRLDLVSFESGVPVPGSCFRAPASAKVAPKVMRYYVGRGNGQFDMVQTLSFGMQVRDEYMEPIEGLPYGEVMDINGDSRPDLLFLYSRWIQGADGRFAEVQRGPVEGAVYGTPSNLGNQRMLVVDANGDGKQDLILIDPTPTLTVPSQIVPPGTTAEPVKANPHIAALYINDGTGEFKRDDRPLAGMKALGAVRSCPCPTVLGTHFQPTRLTLGSGANGSMAVDINGDGLPDFVAWATQQENVFGSMSPASKLWVYLSKAGTDAGKTDASVPGLSASDVNGSYAIPELNSGGYSTLLGDFLGVGAPGFLRMGYQGNNSLFARVGPPADLLHNVVNVSGARTVVHYSSTAIASLGVTMDGSSVITPGIYFNRRPAVDASTVAAHTWPTYHLHPAMWLVSRTEQDSATLAVDSAQDLIFRNKVTTAYSYAGLKADLSGAGSLGYESVTKYFPYANGGMLATTTEYFQATNSAPNLRDGSDRQGVAGLPKCTFTRYDPSWVPNSALLRQVDDGAYFDRRGRRVSPLGAPTEQPQSLGSGVSNARQTDCFDADEKPSWAAQVQSMSTFVYCDLQATSAAASATAQSPCGTPSLIKRPYQYKTIERTWDLKNPTRLVSKVETTHSRMSPFGDVRESTAVTTGFEVGGYTAPQVYTKTNLNTYFDGEDAPGERFINANKWLLGRLKSSQVTSTVPSVAPTRDNSGLSAAARATQDPALTSTPPRLMRPEVLLPILQLLLED